MANENTTFNPELVGFKRYKTPAGNYAHNVTYDGNPVGLIGKSAQGFGNPWIGFLFSENGHIAAGSGTDIKAVKSATARAVGANLAILTGPPKPTPKPEPEVDPNEAEVALGSGAFAPAAAFVGQPVPASTPAPEAKPKPEPKVAADPTYCLCDCGEATGPKSKFRQGHDARVKGKLSRAEASLEGWLRAQGQRNRAAASCCPRGTRTHGRQLCGGRLWRGQDPLSSREGRNPVDWLHGTSSNPRAIPGSSF